MPELNTDREEEAERLKLALKACAEGDRESFSKVYALTSRKFFAIVVRMVKDEDTARDILQQAYVSIWKNAARYDAAKASPFTWMLVIMRNRAIDYLRSASSRSETAEIDDSIPSEAISPDRHADRALLGQILTEHMGRLPEKMAMSIRLRVLEGLTCDEIGHYLKVPRNTVQSWIRRGMLQLRKDLPFETLEQAI